MREYTEYYWKENNLYYGKRKSYRILPHEEHTGMFWLINPEGEKIDFYNLQRAKDNARKLDAQDYNQKCRQRRTAASLIR